MHDYRIQKIKHVEWFKRLASLSYKKDGTLAGLTARTSLNKIPLRRAISDSLRNETRRFKCAASWQKHSEKSPDINGDSLGLYLALKKALEESEK